MRGMEFGGSGRVGCPLNDSDVAIEACIGCGQLLRVVIDDDPPYFLCTVWPPIRMARGSGARVPDAVIRSIYCLRSVSPR